MSDDEDIDEDIDEAPGTVTDFAVLGRDDASSLSAVAGLAEIAFWLERRREETHRVQAYRKAAWALGALPRGEVQDRIADGTLTDVRNVGPKTAKAATEIAADGGSSYLDELRHEGAAPLDTGGEELRAALRGDLHAHSDWSDGGSPIDEVVTGARFVGHDYLALTDHSPRLTVAHGLTAERLAEQLDVVEATNERVRRDGGPQFTLLPAIEVDIREDGSLDQTDEMLGRLDVVTASVHSKLRSDAETMTHRMVGAIANPLTNVLGHCTGRLVEGGRGTRPESEFDAEVVFAACAKFDVAVEINSRPERRDPPSRLIRLALESGCLFSIDTDAHAPGQLAFCDYGCARAAACDVPADRVVNTWPLERLLEWTHDKR